MSPQQTWSQTAGLGSAAPNAWDTRQAASFWCLAVLQTLFLAAASAPSPLYAIYQAEWGFSTITLTAVYAVYAVGALSALLVLGRASDHLGRRRVTSVGLLIQIVAMLTFVAAQSVEWLYAARILQGVATGIASGAISAWLLDLQPPRDRQLGGLVNSVALMGGLALGALSAGLLAQYAPDPLQLVFWLLLVGYVVALAAMPGIPDPVSRRAGWQQSLRPKIGIPTVARPMFSATAPSLIAIWAVAGLYLALGASLANSLLDTDSHVAGGMVIVALLGAGAVASFAVRAGDPRVLVIRGSVILIAGLTVTLLAVTLGSSVALYLGSLIAGIGLGPAFSGIFRSLAPLAPPDRRAALLAAVYVVVYLSFSIPAILAGIAVTRFGLQDTALGFGVVAIVLAGATTIALSRRAPQVEPAR